MRPAAIDDSDGSLFLQPARLVVRSPPQDDESLYGWALRLAEANGYRNAQEILSLAKYGSGSRLSLKDRLAGLVSGSLKDFARYFPNGKMAYHRGRELGLATRFFSTRPKVCPACLGEKSSLKSVWNLKVWQYCPRHMCTLIETCPFCMNPLRTSQRAVVHCGNPSCNGDLSHFVSEPVPRDVRNIVGLLADVSTGHRSDRFPNLSKEFLGISVRGLVHLIAILGKPLLNDDDRRSEQASAHKMLKTTERALGAWPNSYHQYLSRVHATRLDPVKYPHTGWQLGVEFPFLLKDLKYGTHDIPTLLRGYLKDELANYIERHVPHLVGAQLVLTGKPSRWAKPHRATRDLGLSDYRVRMARRAKVIKSTAFPVGTKTRYFVARDDLLACTDELTAKSDFKAKYSLASFVQAARRLQVRKSVINSFVQAGYIETITHSGATYCKPESLEAFLSRLVNVAVALGMEGRRTIKLSCCLYVSTAKLTDVIQGALLGRICLIDGGEDRQGLSRFLVDRDDLERLCPLMMDGYVNVAQASRYPYWNNTYLWTAIRCGLLPSVAHPRSGRMFSQADFAIFRSEYINCSELKCIYGISPERTSVELADTSAVVADTGPTKLWYRQPALATLDQKFPRLAP